MKQLIKFFSQILLALVLISSIKTADAATTYKLTSFINDYNGNVSLWDGKGQVSLVTYVDFCNNSIGWFYPLDVEAIWNHSSIPLITWKIAECNHGDGGDPGIMKLINKGNFDAYISYFGDRLKKWLAGPDGIYGTDDDRRAYLRLGMKFDGIAYSLHVTRDLGFL